MSPSFKVLHSGKHVVGDYWKASYYGGEYIELSVNGKAVEVINVWDYEKGRRLASAPVTQEEVRKRLIEWLDENRSDLHHYAR